APLSSSSAFLQPARAWSKNGLFMVLGTSAKTYFLDAASVPWLMARIAIAATVAPSSFLSICVPPLLDGWVDGTRMSVPPTPADPIEQNRENDDDADEQSLPVAVDAGHEKAVADDLDQGGAEERAEGA